MFRGSTLTFFIELLHCEMICAGFTALAACARLCSGGRGGRWGGVHAVCVALLTCLGGHGVGVDGLCEGCHVYWLEGS